MSDIRTAALDLMDEMIERGSSQDAELVGELVMLADEVMPLRTQLAEARTYVGILEARLAEHERNRETVLAAFGRDL